MSGRAFYLLMLILMTMIVMLTVHIAQSEPVIYGHPPMDVRGTEIFIPIAPGQWRWWRFDGNRWEGPVVIISAQKKGVSK